jgi:hypothetical protein
MDESERNRPDVGSGESPPEGSADDAFARWSAARARVRNHPALLEGEGEGAAAPFAQTGMEDLRGELERERRLRASFEVTLKNVAMALDRERDRRRAAEARADAVFAELEIATHAAHNIPTPMRLRLRLRRAFRRISGRL